MASNEKFFQKLKLAWLFLRNQENMSVKQCEYCGSTNIKKINGHHQKMVSPNLNGYAPRHYIQYNGHYVCCRCGANSIVEEQWELQPSKIYNGEVDLK